MRFCPFCSAENADELASCLACGRRLPPLPPRRARNAPPTGVQLPPRAGATLPPRRADASQIMPRTDASAVIAAQPSIASAPVPPPLPPAAPTPPSVAVQPGPDAAQVNDDAARRSLLHAISPGPAAQRSAPPPPEPRAADAPSRRRSDASVAIPKVTTRPPPISAATPTPSLFPNASALPTTTGQFAASEATDIQSPPIDLTSAPLRGAARPGGATAFDDPSTGDRPAVRRPPPVPLQGDGPTMPYPLRAPSPSPGDLEDPDVATKLNAIGRKVASPSATTAVTAEPPATTPPPLVDPHAAPLRGAARPGEAGAIAARLPLQAAASVVTATPTPITATPTPVDDTQPTAAPHLTAVPPPMPQIVPAAPPSIAPPMMPMMPMMPMPPIAPIVPIERSGAAGPRSGAERRGDMIDIRGRPHTPTDADPPPTRIQRPEQYAERPFTPPKVLPIPEVPEPGLVTSARYAYWFARARYQRRGAIRILGIEIKQDTEALDHVLGALGREARRAGVESRVFSAENAAIAGAEQRVLALHREHTEVDARKADEGSKFVDIERDRNAKLAEAERMVEEAQRELAALDGQRRNFRDKRKDIERRQKAYLKAAEDANRQAGGAQMGDQRSELRRVSESHSVEAAALEPERQELDRKIAVLDRPITEATAKLDAAKAELDAAKRSLNDAREGHTHRLAELDAEHKRKAREIALAEGEIARRLVTLGTLVNLNRIEDPSFGELYERIDRLRGAITARTTEIERLAAERDAYDRGALVRGVVVIGAAVVAFIALVVILRAIL